MKNNIMLFLASLIVVLVLAVVEEGKKIKDCKDKSTKLENTISNLNQEIETLMVRTENGDSVKVSRVKTLEVTKNNVEAAYGGTLKATGVKVKYVDRIVNVSTEIHSVDTIICQVDSFGGLKANYKDDFASIKVSVDSTRKAEIDYSVKDSLSIINYQKKHSILFGLIKWKSHEGCEVINHNPKSTPVTLMSYKVIGK